MKTIIIGISGISGAGKSTLATRLYDFFINPKNVDLFEAYKIKKTILLQQDKYFYARDSPHHIWIPEINFINRELLTAMDMKRFNNDVQNVINELNNQSIESSFVDNYLNILIIEGFLIFNESIVNDLCNLRFHLYLSYEMGLKRRLTRNFKHVNPQPEWYFKNFIWPSYQKHLNELPNKNDLIFLNGEQNIDFSFDQMIESIRKCVP